MSIKCASTLQLLTKKKNKKLFCRANLFQKKDDKSHIYDMRSIIMKSYAVAELAEYYSIFTK